MRRVKKLTKFFLNLQKTKATQGTVKKLEIDNKETDNSIEIDKNLEGFFENLFTKETQKNETCIQLISQRYFTADLKPGGKSL